MLVLFLCLSGASYAQQREFTTGVSKSMSIDEARREAFREAKFWVDVSGFPTIDPNLLVNRQQIQKGAGIAGQNYITVFPEMKAYSVHKSEDENKAFYTSALYTLNGHLLVIEFTVNDGSLSKGYRHIASPIFGDPIGTLLGISLQNNRDGFTFLPDGSLSSHWIGDKCYKPDGSSCGTRRSFIAAGD